MVCWSEVLVWLFVAMYSAGHMLWLWTGWWRAWSCEVLLPKRSFCVLIYCYNQQNHHHP